MDSKCRLNWISFIIFISYVTLSYSLCDIESGENVAIVTIPESNEKDLKKNNKINLPISGSLDKVSLQVLSETHHYFQLEGKSLVLIKPLDRDKNGPSSIYMQISCTELSNKNKKNIPVLVKVLDINDNAPIFTKASHTVNISELVEPGTVIYDDLLAIDADSGNNGLVEYFTQPGDRSINDGFDYFAIEMPHKGLVTVKKPLDYEKASIYFLHIVASDKSLDPSERLSSTVTLVINVLDGDDLPTQFTNLTYRASITTSSLGILDIHPSPIKAYDLDTLNTSVIYSFYNGTPSNYGRYFRIDKYTGRINQTALVNISETNKFNIIVKAVQEDNAKRYSFARVLISVHKDNLSPPIIRLSSNQGIVEENSPKGTLVMEKRNISRPLKITVYDPDVGKDENPLIYQFEVTNNGFIVNSDGYLAVNDQNLDRDLPYPSTYTLQVIARELNGNRGSAPVSIKVNLLDVNDNPPKLPSYPAIHLQAGEGARDVFKVEAKDLDESDQEKITYSIYHVSNNGKNLFRINSQTGQIQAVGKLNAGDQYSLTIQSYDGKHYSQSILDIYIIRGANRNGPSFIKTHYDIDISESVSMGTMVLTVKAIDPEGDDVHYEIIDGNGDGHFIIDKHTGTITTTSSLDREQISTYTLTIKASDPYGLFGIGKVYITLSDVNDCNPVFTESIYKFKMDEGIVGYVGTVKAVDADIGDNAKIVYSLEGDGFTIGEDGAVLTTKPLDYENTTIHHLLVTARDSSTDPRMTTVPITVQVLDTPDELPYFSQSSYEALCPENIANRPIVKVTAHDPDTIPMITYLIREVIENDNIKAHFSNKTFAIDSATGVIRTLIPLDYELIRHYTLIIGTLENNSNEPSSTTIVTIKVADSNDNAPVWVSLPGVIRISDSVPLGTKVGEVKAIDSDGSAPNNVVRYELGKRVKNRSGINREKEFFMIDKGVIYVKDDLRKDRQSEYRLVVNCLDGGNPSLSTSTLVTVFVEHIVQPVKELPVGFPDSKYTIEIEENVPVSTLLKTMTIMNKNSAHLSCDIVSGNSEALFRVTMNNNKDCELYTNGPIDYEENSKYILNIRLNTGQKNSNTPSFSLGYSRGGRSHSSNTSIGIGVPSILTTIIINIIDLNDNKPAFILPKRYSHLTDGRYLSGIALDAPSESQILQVVANDHDSLSNGQVTYEILPGSDSMGRFKIDPSTGILRTSRPMEDIDPNSLPLKVTVIARDSPSLRSSSLTSEVQVIVNVIEEIHRIALVLKDVSTERVQEFKEELLELLQEKTSLIAGWEKAESRKIFRNHSIESDVTGSDVWFYLIEGGSFKILEASNLKVKERLWKEEGKILKSIGTMFGNGMLRKPYVMVDVGRREVIKEKMEGWPLVGLGVIIAFLGIGGIIYVSRGKKVKVLPNKGMRIYEPIYVGKEYETQVLQMEMKLDDESLRGSWSSPSSRDSSGNGRGSLVREQKTSRRIFEARRNGKTTEL